MRFFICKLTISVLSAFSVLACTETSKVETDVLIIGGGASGTAAAIASARMGSKTILVAEDQWLGGMLTSAGVSAVDGNTKLPSGVWGEFRDSLVVRYGSLDNLRRAGSAIPCLSQVWELRSLKIWCKINLILKCFTVLNGRMSKIPEFGM